MTRAGSWKLLTLWFWLLWNSHLGLAAPTPSHLVPLAVPGRHGGSLGNEIVEEETCGVDVVPRPLHKVVVAGRGLS